MSVKRLGACHYLELSGDISYTYTSETKTKIHETMIQQIFVYKLECWAMRKQDDKRILQLGALPKHIWGVGFRGFALNLLQFSYSLGLLTVKRSFGL